MEISASSKNPVPFRVLIAAAGSGSRLGGEVPKQYQKIGEKAILRHTIEAFIGCPGLLELHVIIDPAQKDLYANAVKGLDLPEPIDGGITRKESIYNGLKAISKINYKDVVLIHDAARPFITYENIMAVTAAAQSKKAATLAYPVTDTQKYCGGDYIDRNGLWAIQTPQGFEYDLILQAHREANNNTEYTDDTSLVAALGYEVTFIKGPRTNIKITTPEDIELACKLAAPSGFESRTGFGYDVHAFEDGDHVILCGTQIPHDKSLKGHSDADAGLHALTDALLGTIGAGDIGTLFPPSDPQWKDANSAIFLQKAVEMIEDKGGVISNIDLTLICEEPKIGPHRETMQKRVADICNLSTDRVGIKATTNEKLGFLGRGEGIAAQAIATVRFPLKDVEDD